jgi:hypothetical protein
MRKFLLTIAALALAAPLSAAPITFHSGDGGDILLSAGALTPITPHAAWGDVSPFAGLPADTARWISYANTGIGGIIAPNAATRTRPDATAVFSRQFVLGGTGQFDLWILTDDTAAVDLIGPGGTTVLFDPFQGQIDPCAPGGTGIPIGCVDADMGHASMTLGPGAYDLRVYAFQTNRDVFGAQYAGSVPEPASLMLLGTGLVGLLARRRIRK